MGTASCASAPKRMMIQGAATERGSSRAQCWHKSCSTHRAQAVSGSRQARVRARSPVQPPRWSDPAGSGRIPAALSNIVGPSRDLVSTTGVVPVCRPLDCISILALTTDDTATVLAVIAGPDRTDPYSRSLPVGALDGNVLAPTAWYPERFRPIVLHGRAGRQRRLRPPSIS
jgi:hypothetical protein